MQRWLGDGTPRVRTLAAAGEDERWNKLHGNQTTRARRAGEYRGGGPPGRPCLKPIPELGRGHRPRRQMVAPPPPGVGSRLRRPRPPGHAQHALLRRSHAWSP
ncbi:hypothetical protein QJS66_18220 [Kocuria rhizophila]|nr:hypothetical protein QJS66_18220 [Kocuria rhizophila]